MTTSQWIWTAPEGRSGEVLDAVPDADVVFLFSGKALITGDAPVVRTFLSVDAEEASQTFAGDTPQGSFERPMHANADRPVDGAASAAKACLGERFSSPELALLAGFDAFGEISRINRRAQRALRHQTVTITTCSER